MGHKTSLACAIEIHIQLNDSANQHLRDDTEAGKLSRANSSSWTKLREECVQSFCTNWALFQCIIRENLLRVHPHDNKKGCAAVNGMTISSLISVTDSLYELTRNNRDLVEHSNQLTSHRDVVVVPRMNSGSASWLRNMSGVFRKYLDAVEDLKKTCVPSREGTRAKCKEILDILCGQHHLCRDNEEVWEEFYSDKKFKREQYLRMLKLFVHSMWPDSILLQKNLDVLPLEAMEEIVLQEMGSLENEEMRNAIRPFAGAQKTLYCEAMGQINSVLDDLMNGAMSPAVREKYRRIMEVGERCACGRLASSTTTANWQDISKARKC